MKGNVMTISLWNTRTDVPLIDRIRIQVEILLPIVRELRTELGKQKAKDILSRAFTPMFKEVGRRYFENSDRKTLEAMQAWSMDCAADDAETSEIRQNGEVLEVDVTRCEYAKYFNDLGEPELGYLLVCSSDYGVFEEIKGVKMTRSKTIMQGSSHCDFRFRFTNETEAQM
jgi:hypothetical protein